MLKVFMGVEVATQRCGYRESVSAATVADYKRNTCLHV